MLRVTLGDIVRKTAIKMLVATLLVSLLAASAHCSAIGDKEVNVEKVAVTLPEEKKVEGNLLPKTGPVEIPLTLPEELPASLPQPLPEIPGRILPESLPLPQGDLPLPQGDVPVPQDDLNLSEGNLPLPEGLPKGDVGPQYGGSVPANGVVPDGDKTDLDTDATFWGLYGGFGYRRPYRRWGGYGGYGGWGGRGYGGYGGWGGGYGGWGSGYHGYGRGYGGGYGGWGRGYGGYGGWGGGYWR